MSRGESSLPTVLAGQTAVQRPHSVQASRSSRSFQVKPSSELTPKRLGLLEVDVLERRAERGEVGGVDVERRGHDVHHLRVRQPRDEGETRRPDETTTSPTCARPHRLDAHQRPRRARDEIAERRPRAPRVVRRRDAPALDEKSLQAHQKDGRQNQRRLVGVDQLPRPLQVAPRGGHQRRRPCTSAPKRSTMNDWK